MEPVHREVSVEVEDQVEDDEQAAEW